MRGIAIGQSPDDRRETPSRPIADDAEKDHGLQPSLIRGFLLAAQRQRGPAAHPHFNTEYSRAGQGLAAAGIWPKGRTQRSAP